MMVHEGIIATAGASGLAMKSELTYLAPSEEEGRGRAGGMGPGEAPWQNDF